RRAISARLLPEDAEGPRVFYAMRVGPAREMNSANLLKKPFAPEILVTENARASPVPKDQQPDRRSRHLRVAHPVLVEKFRREDFESESPNQVKPRRKSEEPWL